MKVLIEPSRKEDLCFECTDGVILALEDYSVESTLFFTLDEIMDIRKKFSREVFVKLNKNLLNEDVDRVKDILIQLDKVKVNGVFFYDLAILEIVRELHLDIPLVWNQTHMVNNYKTCDYYHSKGVTYALLGKEITLEEIQEIIEKSKVIPMVEVISRPSVAFSKRHLITNYCIHADVPVTSHLSITEKVTDTNYDLFENQNGTSFFLDAITNGTSIIKDLNEVHCAYIIIREYGIEDGFKELVQDTHDYILGGCVDNHYLSKYEKLGDNTNFFFKKTIYRVKKNG